MNKFKVSIETIEISLEALYDYINWFDEDLKEEKEKVQKAINELEQI